MLPKKKIAAAFVLITAAAVAALVIVAGAHSHTSSRFAAPAAYIKNVHNTFSSDLFNKYNKINVQSTSDAGFKTSASFTASSDEDSAAKSCNSSKASASKTSASKAASSQRKASSGVSSSSAAAAYFPLTSAERDKVERVVMTSCGELGDSLMAKANAQVILDRVKSGRFGKNLKAVLDAPHQFERPWKGSINTLVKNAVAAIFDRGERVTKERIYYYENPNLKEISTAVWCRDKRYITTIGHGEYIHEYWTDKD